MKRAAVEVEVVRSYILVQREGDVVHYVSYGHPAMLTTDLKNARRYARIASANSAVLRMIERPGFPVVGLKVEPIDE